MEIIVNERVSEVFKYLKTNRKVTSQKDFAKIIGSDEATVSNILRQKLDVPNNFLAKISKAFPQINPQWLQTGEGEMVVEVKKQVYYGGDENPMPDETVASFVKLLIMKEESLQKSQSQIDSLIELVNKLTR